MQQQVSRIEITPITRDEGKETRKALIAGMVRQGDADAKRRGEGRMLAFAQGLAVGVVIVGLVLGVRLQDAMGDAAGLQREADRQALNAIFSQVALDACLGPSDYVPHVTPLPEGPQAR